MNCINKKDNVLLNANMSRKTVHSDIAKTFETTNAMRVTMLCIVAGTLFVIMQKEPARCATVAETTTI